MLSPSPFRSEDLLARVETLRAERQALVRQLHEARRVLRASRRWSWGRFVLGMLVVLAVGSLAARL